MRADGGTRGRRSTLFEPAAGSASLIIVCSGRLMGYKIDRFSFDGPMSRLPVNRYFIRDNFGLYYHAGLEGVSEGVTDTALHLAEFVEAHDFRRVSVLGLSSGGYAALLFGELIGADAIYAISPRTLLHPDAERFAERDRHGVVASLEALMARPGAERDYFDLAAVFRRQPVDARTCVVFYDPEHPLDAFHAERLGETPGVVLERHPGAGHGLAGDLIADPAFFDRVAAGD